MGCLQDLKISISGGDLALPMGGNPPVWGIPITELNRSWFPSWGFHTDRWRQGGRPPGRASNSIVGCPVLGLAPLSCRRKEGQSWQNFTRYPWQIELPTSRPHRGHLALRTALGLVGLESRSGPCVQRAHSPQSKLLRGWLGRHSLETPGPWSGRQNKMTHSKGYLS